jgi:N-acetylmuramoyl-L-alanine amidase
MKRREFIHKSSTLLALPLFSSQKNFKVRTVVIDAGHGGKDPGTLGKFTKEKEIVLNIALKLGKYIEDNLMGVKVLYTRKTDKYVDFKVRADVANKNQADLFISIHANSIVGANAYGTETFVMGLHKDNSNFNG